MAVSLSVGILSNFLNFGLGPSVEYWATENLGVMASVGAGFDFFTLSARAHFLLNTPLEMAESPMRPYIGLGYANVQGPEENYGGVKAETDGNGIEVFAGVLHNALWLHPNIFLRGEFCYSTVELEATVSGYGGSASVSTEYSAFTVNFGVAYYF